MAYVEGVAGCSNADNLRAESNSRKVGKDACKIVQARRSWSCAPTSAGKGSNLVLLGISEPKPAANSYGKETTVLDATELLRRVGVRRGHLRFKGYRDSHPSECGQGVRHSARRRIPSRRDLRGGNGEEIPILKEKLMPVVTAEGTWRGRRAQVADVS